MEKNERTQIMIWKKDNFQMSCTCHVYWNPLYCIIIQHSIVIAEVK